jgi:hypothetical protein
MSDLKSRVIGICMLVGALAMIGLAMSGTLQMSRLPVAQVATKMTGGLAYSKAAYGDARQLTI